MEKETTNNELLEFMKGQFESTEKRFDGVDDKLFGIDKKLSEHDVRFEKLDSRLTGLENRIDAIAGIFTHDFMERFYKLEQQVQDFSEARVSDT